MMRTKSYKKKEFSFKGKCIFTALIILALQVLSCIPIYGINREYLSMWLTDEMQNAFSLFNLFSGNAFSNMSIFVIGISPFITASIILQLLTMAIPKLEELAKDGKVGQDKYKKLNYIVAGVLAVVQSIPIALNFGSQGLLIEYNFKYVAIVSVTMIIGSILMIFCGKLIDDYGIGNGISLILLMNILSRMPSDIATIYEMFCKGKNIGSYITTLAVSIFVVVVALVGVIYLQDGEKKLKATSSAKIRGSKSVAAGYNEIPMKVNMAGVMPVIFASSLFQSYTLIITLCGASQDSVWYKISRYLNTGNWFDTNNLRYTIGFVVYCLLIYFFTYFYSSIVFNPIEVADNLKKQGAMISGVRPGKPTSDYLEEKMKSLRIVGSIMLIGVCLIPILIAAFSGLHSLSFGGTSIIIIVGVILECYQKINSERLVKKTSGFLSR